MARSSTAIILATAIAVLAADCLHGRTWTDRRGRQVEADFVSVKDGNVTIKRAGDGKLFAIPLGTLSDEDQAYVRSQTGNEPREASAGLLAKYDRNSPGDLPGTIVTLDGKSTRVDNALPFLMDCCHPVGVKVGGSVTLLGGFQFPTKHGHFERSVDPVFLRSIASTEGKLVATLNDGVNLAFNADVLGSDHPLFGLKIGDVKSADVQRVDFHHATAYRGHAGRQLWTITDKSGNKLTARSVAFRYMDSSSGAWRFQEPPWVPGHQDVTVDKLQSLKVAEADAQGKLAAVIRLTDGEEKRVEVESYYKKAGQIDLMGDDVIGRFAIPLAEVGLVSRAAEQN